MRTKHRNSIYIAISFPLIALIPLIANLYFQPQFILFSKLSLWFVVPALVSLIPPLGNYRIGGNSTKIKYPLLGWVFMVLITIVFTFILYLTESVVLLGQGNQHYDVNVRHGISQIFDAVWLHSIAFPWSILVATLVIFAVRSKLHSFHPFSSWVPREIFSLQIGRLVRKTMDACVENCARLFVMLLLSFLIFQLLILLGFKTFYAFPTILTLAAMLMLPYSKLFKRVDGWIKSYKLPPIITFGLIILAIIVLFFLMRLLLYFAQPYLDPTTQMILSIKMPATISRFWKPTWELWYWSWWLLVAPLLASIIVKFSYGRSLRSIVLLLLIIPTVTTLLCHFYPAVGQRWIRVAVTFLLRPHATFLLQLIAQIFFLSLFLFRSGYHILWLGFVPFEKPLKVRIFPTRALWYMALAFVGALTMRTVYGVTMLQLFVAPYLLILLFITAVYRLPSAVKKQDEAEG